jgi:hypothetical protein
MRMKFLFIILPVLFLFANVQGNIINVPGDSATIQAAINGASVGDTVLVAQGTYIEQLNFLGKDIFLTSNYLYSNDTLDIQNTIIDGDQTRSDTMCVIIFCNSETSDAVVQGFTIQNGQGYKNEYDRWLGGGIMCIHSSPTVTHNIIRWNSAAHCGGGICGFDTSNVLVTYNTFTENSAGTGGAIMFAESSPVISYNDIIDNFADTTGYPTFMTMGGGILAYKCASTITHNNISENTASMGGGICSYVLGTDLIAENVISFNSAVGDSGLGGGICGFHTFSGAITDNIISDNWASGSGGGGIHLYLSNIIPGENALIINNIITGNTTGGSGGGIYLQNFSNGSIIGNLLTYNEAPDGGGGGISYYNSGIPITENTIAHNTAIAGGAVHGFANADPPPVYITNTICWDDTGTSIGNEIWMVGMATAIVSYCDVEGGHAGEGNIDCNPEFCDPYNGDFTLAETSCCIDAGEGGVDIGAFGIGCEQPVNIFEDIPILPVQFSLLQNYPNPFNPITTIKYSLPTTSDIRLDIYDILGRKVATLVNNEQPAGNYQVTWNADNVTSGMYFYKIKAGGYTETRKMLLLK